MARERDAAARLEDGLFYLKSLLGTKKNAFFGEWLKPQIIELGLEKFVVR